MDLRKLLSASDRERSAALVSAGLIERKVGELNGDNNDSGGEAVEGDNRLAARSRYAGADDKDVIDMIEQVRLLLLCPGVRNECLSRKQSIIERDLGVTFDSIAALDDAKRLLKETIVVPLLLPSFFHGNLIRARASVQLTCAI